MNIKILREVQAAIRKHPEHIFMEQWYSCTPCGATACIAGWIYSLNKGLKISDDGKPDFFDDAELFDGGCDPNMGIVAARIIFNTPWGFIPSCKLSAKDDLFLQDCWPRELNEQYSSADSSDLKADAACKAIDWWIERYAPEGEFVQPVECP